MNWDTAKANWTLFKGNMQIRWGKLTNDHLSTIAGRRDQWAGKIQKTYGVTQQLHKKQVKGFGGSERDHRHRI